jgi:hypothetical protein
LGDASSTLPSSRSRCRLSPCFFPASWAWVNFRLQPFRREDGAKAFGRIRRDISTARKNANGALEAFQRFFTGTSFVPLANTS